MNAVCGFIVVRTPSENYDAAGRGVFPSQPPTLSGVYYGGIDRMQWFDVDEALFDKSIPSGIASSRRIIKTQNIDFSGIDIVTDIDLAIEMLNFSNRKMRRNEIIAISSPILAEIKQKRIDYNNNIEWFGIDLVDIGHSSLLRDGLFGTSSCLSHLSNSINKRGLLSNKECAMRLLEEYRKYMALGVLEQLIEEPYGVDCVWIGSPSF